MEDVIIVGAGVAGLSAALELKRLGATYRILEASDCPGGRARSRALASGIVADLGAHWLHGEDNALKAELDRYGIAYGRDTAEVMWVHENGELRQEDANWLDSAIDEKKARAVRSGAVMDCALPDLATDAESYKVLSDFACMWNGVDAPVRPSAREFLSDENTPGGLQVEGGMGALINKMAEEAGPETIHLRTSVSRIQETPDGVRIQAMDGSVWMAQRVIFTGSLGVLQSRLLSFAPPLSRDFYEHIAGLVMGKTNKIVIELDHQFIKEREIPVDMSLQLLDADPPHFCHIHSHGAPVIQLYVSGQQAEKVEAFAPDEALAYARKILSPVFMLEGFEIHVVSPAIVTRWIANPYTRGAYSCCLPGARRSGPRREGLICFAGDTFDEQFPASVAGAFRSGKAAARMMAADLKLGETAEA